MWTLYYSGIQLNFKLPGGFDLDGFDCSNILDKLERHEGKLEKSGIMRYEMKIRASNIKVLRNSIVLSTETSVLNIISQNSRFLVN